MSNVTRIDNWALGSDNRTDRARMPGAENGAVSFVEGVNIDVMASGRIISRTGFEKDPSLVTSGNTAVQIAGHGSTLMVLEKQTSPTVCGKLVKRSASDTTGSVISTVAHTVRMASCVHNDELLISLSNGEGWRIKNGVVRQWGVPMAYHRPMATKLVAGNLDPGAYKFSITFVNAMGEESGAVIVSQITLDEGHRGILFSGFSGAIPDGCSARFYMSPVNASSMYLQAEMQTYHNLTMQSVRTNSLALDTKYMRSLPPAGDIICSYKGVVLMAKDNVIWVSQPMRIHLFDMATGFFQFSSKVTNVISVDAGVFVTTKTDTYFLANPETTETSMRHVYEIGGIANSAVKFKEDKAAWMTVYGQAIGTNEGQVDLPHQDKYTPALGAEAAAAIINNDGAEMIVTSMRQPVKRSAMAASGYFDSEVVTAVKSSSAMETVGVSDSYEAETT